jgi:hypothetical protein
MTTPRPPAASDPYVNEQWDDQFDPKPGRRSGPSPGLVMFAIALVGSIVFSIYVITVRDASQIPLMASGSVVLAIVFIALAIYCARATWHAGLERRDGRAIAIGLAGGIAAMIGALFAAAAIILFLLATSTKPA